MSANQTAVPRHAYSVQEFCVAVGISESFAYRLLKEGQVRSVLVSGRRLVPAAAIDEFLNAGDSTPPKPNEGVRGRARKKAARKAAAAAQAGA
jgi:excisionase family DNA binding protein